MTLMIRRYKNLGEDGSQVQYKQPLEQKAGLCVISILLFKTFRHVIQCLMNRHVVSTFSLHLFPGMNNACYC